MYPRIGFFRKLPYLRIRILPIPIRVSVSVLHSLQYLELVEFTTECGSALEKGQRI